jgi:hypothetical protein
MATLSREQKLIADTLWKRLLLGNGYPAESFPVSFADQLGGFDGTADAITTTTATNLTLTSTMADGSTAVGVAIDTTGNWSNGTAKLLSIRRAGTERVYFDRSGQFMPASGGLNIGSSGALTWNSVFTNALADSGGIGRVNIFNNSDTTIKGTTADGSTAVAVKFGNYNTLTTFGAKIAVFYGDNITTEKMYIDKDGGLGIGRAGGSGGGTIDSASTNGLRLSTSNLSNGDRIILVINGSNAYRSCTGDNSGAVAHSFSSRSQLNTAGAKIAVFYNDDSSTQKLAIDKDGRLIFDATDASGSPGAATINKPSGQVAVASGASSVVVTNALVSATSVVLAVLQDTTDSIQVKGVTPAAGSFTITLTGVTSAARKVGFVVFN